MIKNLQDFFKEDTREICLILVDLSNEYLKKVIDDKLKNESKINNDFKKFYYKYTKDRLENIESLLKYCVENKIDIINANYNTKTYKKFDIRYNLKKIYLNWTISLGKKIYIDNKYHYDVFNPKKYKKIFYCGLSIDACLLDTRYFSFNNINHNEKYLLFDCSIQYFKVSRDIKSGKLFPDGFGHEKGYDRRNFFNNKLHFNNYIKNILQFYIIE